MANPPTPRSFPPASNARLSVVIPAYNARSWIPRTVEAASAAIENSLWKSFEFVIVDDGSTDGTHMEAQSLAKVLPVKVIRQPNSGRLLARKAGVMAASGDYVLLLDTRVLLGTNSLQFVSSQIDQHADRVVWNGHVEVERKGNPYARFWHVLTSIAWHRYFGNPRLVSYSTEDFDHYPKGTGCFLAPTALLREANERFTTLFSNSKYSSDDTSLIHVIADKQRIFLSPEFDCSYHSRENARKFVSHVYFRGIHFIDGFLHPGNRFFAPLVAFLVLSIPAIVVTVLFPKLLLAIPVACLGALIVAMAFRIPFLDALTFALLLPMFFVTYATGIWTGFFMAIRKLLAR